MTTVVTATPDAEAQAADADAWWRANRPLAPGLFRAEIEAAAVLLATVPDAGHPVRRRRVPGLRRLLLPRTRHHMYYVHDPIASEVIVLAIWGAVRGRGPALEPPRPRRGPDA